MKKRRSLREKISRVAIVMTESALVIVAIVMFITIFGLRSTFIESSEKAGQDAEVISSETMRRQIEESLQQSAQAKADSADNALKKFQISVKTVADTVSNMYDNADDYYERSVPLPDAKNKGKLSVQLLFSEKTDTESADVKNELGLLANAQDTLLSVNKNDPNMVSNYIAAKSGIMIQADYIAEKKFDEDGNIMPYEADTRPWYIGASEKQAPFFTSLSRDAHTSGVGIMCGVPFYKGKEFMGVAGAGMYLTELEKAVLETRVGKNGYACMIDGEGKVIFSSGGGETFSCDLEKITDLRQSDQKDLAELVTKAVKGERGIAVLNLDGVDSCVAYSPLETVGWTFFTIIPESEVQAPTNSLLKSLEESSDRAVEDSNGQIRMVLIAMVVVFIILYVLSFFVSKKAAKVLVREVVELTAKVEEIKGENLDFEWDVDTGDEIQVLAESFSSLTERMKQYIKDITDITAKEQRIASELSLATNIQASMVPTNFDDYKDNPMFDLYASMTPAKEVGGDFYDFFLTDDNHIVLVMADVSGKGVPAALFMAKAKTSIKTRAMMGGSPAMILSDVNDQMCEGNEAELFVTVWLAIIDLNTGKGLAANAGHEHPALRHKDGNFELIKYRHSPAVATMEGLPFKEHEFEVVPGDTLYVYTDGVTEATDANNELFGEERLTDALNINPDAKPEELLGNVVNSIEEFVAEAPQFDDLTMMAFTYYGKEN